MYAVADVLSFSGHIQRVAVTGYEIHILLESLQGVHAFLTRSKISDVTKEEYGVDVIRFKSLDPLER